MSYEKIKNLEKLCFDNLNSYEEFELNYNLYSTFKGKSTYLKAYMLILLLSQDRKIDFYKLVESISSEELEDEHIKLVLFIERCTSTGNIRRLLREGEHKEFMRLVENVIAVNKRQLETEISGNNETSNVNGNKEDTIKNSLYISMNSE